MKGLLVALVCAGRLVICYIIPDCFEFGGHLRLSVDLRVVRNILFDNDVSGGILLAKSRHYVNILAVAGFPVDLLPLFSKFVVKCDE